jgi:ubiquinone/menaquinone biosynthesis C-methylase UbiE
MADIDLEALARGYLHRPLSTGSVHRAEAAVRRARLQSGSLAVDVGGGRGGHAAVFASTGATAVVVDRSVAMASEAATVPGVASVVGDSACLPVADDTADLVYFHLSLHYGDWRRSLGEAARVGRPGGTVWVWTLADRHHRASFLARWFPSVADIDEARFPPTGEIAGWLSDFGCRDVDVVAAPEERHWAAGEWRNAVEAGFVSTLQVLPPGELDAGLRRFDAAHPDPEETVVYTLGFVAIAAGLPSLR